MNRDCPLQWTGGSKARTGPDRLTSADELEAQAGDSVLHGIRIGLQDDRQSIQIFSTKGELGAAELVPLGLDHAHVAAEQRGLMAGHGFEPNEVDGDAPNMPTTFRCGA